MDTMPPSEGGGAGSIPAESTASDILYFMSEKQKKLEQLSKELAADATLPLKESNLVFGEGNVESPVVFIGEAPGAEEDRQKRPFVGRSGQLLNQLLAEIGIPRESVYITNIVKRRPPDNRDPLPEEIQTYKPYLTRQIEILAPTLIVPLGRFSMNYFLPDAKITRDQGSVFRLKNYCVMPMFHPAAALRSQREVLPKFRETFHKLPIVLKKCQKLKGR